MSKPLPGQGNANNRITMYGSQPRFSNSNQNHQHQVNSSPNSLYYQHQHASPMPMQYNYQRHPIPPNLQPPNSQLQQMPSAVANQNGNNMQMNYHPQRSPAIAQNMSGPVVFQQFHPQYHLPYLSNQLNFSHSSNMVYLNMVNPRPNPPPQQPLLPPSSQQQMPPQPIQQSHLFTQTSSYSPGPPQHQPAPGPALQPQGPPAKAQLPQRDKKPIPIIDPKTNRNVLEDMEQQQTMTHSTQQSREQQHTTSNSRQNNDGANIPNNHSEQQHIHHHRPLAPHLHIEELSHGSAQSYDREVLSPEQQATAVMHIMHHPTQRLISHHPAPHSMIPHQILQRPPHGGSHVTHPPTIPTRPSSTPSPVVQSTLVNDSIESQHSQALVNSIPTVSAMKPGPEVDLADFNQKALSSCIPNNQPNMIGKNKHKTSAALVSNESPHHYINSNSSPLVNNASNAPALDLNNTSASFPIHSNSTDQNSVSFPNQAKILPHVVDSETSHDSQYSEDGSYFNRCNSASQQTPKPFSNVSVLKRSANTSKFTGGLPVSESNGHPADSECTSGQQIQSSESQVEVEENAVSSVQQNTSSTALSPEPAEQIADVEDTSVLPVASSLPVAQTQPQMKLKHAYSLDQWSPINQDGLKKYSRDFLLKLQNEAMSRPKPANLPELEIVLKDLSKTSYAKNSSYNPMFTPHYLMKPGNVSRQSARQQPVLKTRSIQCGKVSKPISKSPNIVLSISLKDDIKLRESENAWRPNNTVDEDEKFYKQVRGVLNKLTPENFESLKQQFKEFPINTTKRLDKVIDLVFQKAIAEPSFSEFYAKMCYEMMKREVVDDTKPIDKDGKYPSVNFKHLLLNKCQQEFEKNEKEEKNNDIRLEEIEAEQDPEKQKELRLMFEEEERLIRKRSVGNCRFIGELYKLNMLTTKIMHHCISELLKKKEEEPLERACKLLSTIGKDLESHDNDPSHMKGYFTIMEELASKKNSMTISSRVRFMLQDVIDLRKNKWIPRRNENRPKTIQQIAHEAESEKFGMNMNKKYVMASQTSLEADRKAAFQSTQKDWKPHQPTATFNTKFVIDKTKLAPMRESPSEVKLGPSNKNVWHQGSNINKPAESQWNNKPSMETNNFNPGFNSDIRSSKSPSYKSVYKAPAPTPTSTENRYSVLHNVTPSSGSNVTSKSELSISMMGRLRKESSDSERALLEELMSEKKKYSKIYIEEYSCNNDLSDLQQSIQKQNISILDLCYFAFEIGTQLSNVEYHRNMGNLITEIHKQGLTEESTICDAMVDFFLNTIENDLYTDTPYLSKYIAEIIAPLLEADVISFSELSSSSKCLKTEHTDFCFPLFKELLKILGYNKAPTWLQKKWNEADLNLSELIANSEQLVCVYPFFFLGPMEQADFSTVIKVTSNDDLKARIKDVINSHQPIPSANVSLCVDLVNWTKGNFGSPRDLSSSYFHALTSALCEISIIKNKEKQNSPEFSKFIHVYKLLELTEDQEIEVLNSVFLLVQSLEFPKGLLLDCFKCLFQEGAISPSTFKLWSRADQSDNKDVALKQLHSFYQTLPDRPEV